jgi:hypothetical protein
MKTSYWMLAAVAGLIGAGAWHFSQQVEQAAASGPPATAAPTVVTATVATPTAAAPPTTDAPPTPVQVARWIEEAGGADAGKRSAAITALAQAPCELALPVLRRVLISGELVDRPQAINSLRELALGQGDTDGRVREVIREVIYHGDDEVLASQAQDALDVVEESEMK